MNLLALGAGGRTGTEVVKQALTAGHKVTALVHDPAKFRLGGPRLVIKGGDARNIVELAPILLGQDAVISTLGSDKAGDQLLKLSSEALVRGMLRETGVRRVVMMSRFVVTLNYRPTGLLLLLDFMKKGMILDKTSGEAVLRGSGLNSTLVNATRLADGSKSGYRIVGSGEPVTPKDHITRADAADFLLSSLADDSSIHWSPLIASRWRRALSQRVAV